MVAHPELVYPTEAVQARLAAASRPEGNRFVDATALAGALAGSAAAANILLLGVAVQDGRIPVSVGAVERAIDLNGVAVDVNLAAFDWGRRWAHDPEAVERLATAADGGGSVVAMTVPDLPPALAARVDELAGRGDLADTVAVLAADLVGFQDEAYAATFLDAVEEAATVEQRVAAGSTRLTAAVARGLHKLMAYKDEYEVARLMLLPEAQATADAVGGAGASFTWHLHPPMLRALGMKEKLTLGRRARPAIRALRRGKRLRGTRLDPFGRTEMRRLERALPGEYLDAIGAVYERLTADRLDEAVAIAELPDRVHGYEELKLRRIGEYRRELADRLVAFR